ncbi:FtsX-like permease family protein [Nonomuraea sp. NPDC049607]|uniref:ABC transporter permease n=1 Tax=Nonomuraea sp. NPDC049607 TaxID=3154732 RepID=UPI00341D071B
MLRTALHNLLAHKGRLAMTFIAVCLGVAFVSGTLVFADSSAAAYRAAAAKSFDGVAVTVTPKDPPPGTPENQHADGLDDALARKLAAVPGVAAVRPSADGMAVLSASDGTPLRAGSAWANLAASYSPGPDGKDGRYPLAEGRAPRDSGEIAVDIGTADAGRFHLGDMITLATDGPVMTKRLVGLVRTTDSRVTAGGTLALFDLATAQKLFAAPGRYTRIDLTAAPGTAEAVLADRVTEMLPAERAEAVSATAQALQQSILLDTLTRGYTKIPMIFAAVALFIGSFLIINTFTMLVSRRVRDIALLRAIGASRRQVVGSVLAEAALLGLAASVTGFLLGLGIAAALPALLSTDEHPLPRGSLAIGPIPLIAALFVGVGVTMAAALVPSLRAARVAPLEAMRSAQQPPSASRSWIRGAAGTALLLLGAGMLVSLSGAEDASVDNLQSAMFGCALLGAALIVLAPLLAGPVIRLFGTLTGRFGVVGHLARQNALRDPRRTAATAAALMISTALVGGLAVLGESTSRALDRQAAAGLAADYTIGTRDSMNSIDPAAVQRVAAVPGVRTSSAVADSTLFVGGHVRQISGVDPATVGAVMKLDFVNGSLDDLGPGRIALSKTIADAQGVRTGGQVNARIGRDQAFHKYTVVGVYQDNPVAGDALGARTEVQKHAFVPGAIQRILLRADATATEQALRAAVGNSPLLRVQDRAAFVAEAAGTVGNLLTLMYGLLVIGVVIAALGVVNTLAMSVSERTRELGMLRALGLDRSGVRRMVVLEALTIAAFGTLLGLVSALFGAWAVGALANGAIPQYTLTIPWGTLLLVCLLSLAAGALAALVPAQRAAAMRPLQATAQA